MIRKELPSGTDKRLYFTSNPNLIIDHIKFRSVAGVTGVMEPIGFFASDNPEDHLVIERSRVIYNKLVFPFPDDMLARAASEEVEKITA